MSWCFTWHQHPPPLFPQHRCEPCLEKSVRCGGVGNKERGSQERGTRKSRNGRRTFFVGCGGLDRQVSASRVSRLFGVRTGLQSPPTNPPTNSRFLRFGNGRSKCCKRKNPGKSGVFASIRNAKGSLNELRNRRFQVRPLTGAKSTAAVILYWIPAAVFFAPVLPTARRAHTHWP